MAGIAGVGCGGGRQPQPPSSLPRTLSKRSSTHRARRWKCRMTGPSQPSFSSSSRSGRCPTRPQAWAKPTLWAPWVRAGLRWGGARRAPGLLPAFLPPNASSMHTVTLALGGVGTQRDLDKLKRCHKEGAGNNLPFMRNGVGSPRNLGSFSLS